MPPLVLDLDPTTIQQSDVIDKILSSHLDHLVIPFDADYIGSLIKALGAVKPDLKIYGTLHFTMGVESRKSAWDAYEGVYMLRPYFNRDSYPSLPYSRSAYMYDAVNLVINAIHQVGTNREAMTRSFPRSILKVQEEAEP